MFIVTSSELITDPKAQANLDLVRQWQQYGHVILPPVIADRAFSPAYNVHVLLYEFKKDEEKSPSLVSDANVRQHLDATGLEFK